MLSKKVVNKEKSNKYLYRAAALPSIVVSMYSEEKKKKTMVSSQTKPTAELMHDA